MQDVSLSKPATESAPYVAPTDLVPLPSKGKVYPVDSSLHGAETVEIRSMTARDEDILTSRALMKQGKAISMLLKNCMSSKGFDPEEMLVGDRNAVLIAIRITGYGQEYNIEVECPQCGDRKRHVFDLAALPIRPIGAEPIALGQNAFRFDLPVLKRECVFRLPTANDDRESVVISERSRKQGLPDSAVTTKLIQQVVSIGGETDGGKLATLIRNMPARDSRDLRAFMDKINPGIEMVQRYTCSSCSEESEVSVPIGPEFFWPS